MPHISKSKRIGYQSSDVEGKKIDEDVRKSIELLDHYENEREVWATKFKEAEEERMFETKVSIKVLGYLVGEGLNMNRPSLSRKENRAKIRFSRERTIVGDKVPWKDKYNDYRD